MTAYNEVYDLLARSPEAYSLVFVLGALLGSFANVCIYRWPPSDEYPHGRSVVWPGSHCSACGHVIRWYDNIPLFSYLVLRGRCRNCKTEFSPRYLLVEAVTAILFVAAYHHVMLVWASSSVPTQLLHFAAFASLQWVLVVVTFIDLDHKLILDKITYPSIAVMYVFGVLVLDNPWASGLIGAAIGYGVIRLVSDGYYYLTGREGLGYGDGKLLAVVGALWGWPGVVTSLFAGSMLGSVIGTALVIGYRHRGRGQQQSESEVPGNDGKNEGDNDSDNGDSGGDVGGAALDSNAEQVPLRHVEVPFGPFLAAGAVFYLYAQPWLQVALWSMG